MHLILVATDLAFFCKMFDYVWNLSLMILNAQKLQMFTKSKSFFILNWIKNKKILDQTDLLANLV